MDLRPGNTSRSLTGEVVGQYQVQDLIGAGGMGEVYRARDDRLNRTVAIKVLPEQFSGDEQARKRFIRETRMASRVTHPYVATVYDVVEHSGDLLLVMEHIEGDTLRAVLREERLDPDTVARYGLEIAEALAAIHKSGLVHRDLKPGNVMVMPDGHVKVMDFGLARPVELTDSQPTMTPITREGGAVGTPLYMSPEQLRGEEVGPASDLFALGTMLYEAISGVHPFKRSSIAESTAAILNEPPGGGEEPESLSGSGPLRDLVLRLLKKDPGERYADCDQLVGDLGAISRGAMHLSGQPMVSRRTAVGLAVAAVVAVGVLAAGAWWLGQPPAWGGPRYAVAVAPFRDMTGMEDGGVKAAMVSDLLAVDLESSHLVRTVGPQDTMALVRSLPAEAGEEAIANRILAASSVDYVLLGTLYQESGQFVATLGLIPSAPGLRRPATVRAEAASLVALAGTLGAQLRRGLPEVSRVTAWRDGREGVGQVAAGSDEAQLKFERGLIALRDEKLTEAIEWFEAAVAADPAFILGHSRLAGTLYAAGYGRRAREAAERAMRLLPESDSRVDRRLALSVAATRAKVFSRTDEAVAATRELVTLFPDEPALLAEHAQALSRVGEFDESLTLLDQAIEADPLNPTLHRGKAGVLVLADRGRPAFESLNKAEQLYEVVESDAGRSRVAYQRGKALFIQEKLDEALAEFQHAAELLPPDAGELQLAEILVEIGQIELLTGHPDAANARLESAAVLAREAGDLGSLCHALTAQGAQRYLTGDLVEAERMLREAVDLARQLENDLLLLSPLSNLAGLLAYQGQLEQAGTLFAESSELADGLDNNSQAVLARLYLSDIKYQRGEMEQAIASYEAVLEKENVEGLRRLTTWAYLGLAEIHERRGRLSDALEAASRALEIGREGNYSDIGGSALVKRGQLLGRLGRGDEGMPEIELGERIALAAGAGLQDLAARAVLARAVLQGREGRWRAALADARKVMTMEGAGAPAMQAEALALICEGLLATGRSSASLEPCSRAAGMEAAPLAVRTEARALWAAALARSGDSEAAHEQAMAALDDSGSMDLWLATARSATVLLERPGDLPPERIGEIGAQGREALQNFVDAVPEASREAVRRRADVSELDAALSTPEQARAATKERANG